MFYHSYSFSLCILCLIYTAMHLCFEVYCCNVICDAIIIIIIVLFIKICRNERHAHRVIMGTQSWSQIQCYNGSFWNLTAALLSSFPSLRKQSHLTPCMEEINNRQRRKRKAELSCLIWFLSFNLEPVLLIRQKDVAQDKYINVTSPKIARQETLHILSLSSFVIC